MTLRERLTLAVHMVHIRRGSGDVPPPQAFRDCLFCCEAVVAFADAMQTWRDQEVRRNA